MPELPEVETNKRTLEKHIVGKHISSIKILSSSQVMGDPTLAEGRKILSLVRHGKILAIRLDNDIYINIHLKMTGQLLFAPDSRNAVFKHTIPLAGTNTMPGKSTRIIIHFSDGSAVYFNDSRRFGWMKLTREPEKPGSIDVLDPGFTEEFFLKALAGTKKPIRTLLLDQQSVAGIGNIYANESLFEAHIHPTRRTDTLTGDEKRTLYRAILMIIHEGIAHQGSSGKDESYLLPDGSRGMYQHRFRVYQREHMPCRVCNTPIERLAEGGRSAFFCPKCQR